MKLVYRGVSYETKLPRTTTKGKAIGKYRGASLYERIWQHNSAS
ncbi:MAG: DUF4278 domain-containing protein [Elainella sp.]